MSSLSQCPLCGNSVMIMGIEWRCPCCKILNRNWDSFQNCDYCRFNPFYFPCPTCKKEFEIALLTGHYKDPEGHVILADEKPNLWEAREFHLRDLKLGAFPSINQDRSALQLVAEIWLMVKDYPFRFTCPVKSYIVHTVWRDRDKRFWIHGFIHASDDARDATRVGHMTISAETDEQGYLTSPNIAIVEAFPAAKRF